MSTLLILPGDGIGPEIIAQAEKVLARLISEYGLELHIEQGLLGGAAIDATGQPLPEKTLEQARAADAILLGAIGGPKWEGIERRLRPERGLLGIRSALGLFANLRPARSYPQLVSASSLKPELVSGLDILFVRELTSGIYFGEPRGIAIENGERCGVNTMRYTEAEIERIAHSAFTIAQKRTRRLCSVDKANVLEVSELWREVMQTVSTEYPAVTLEHLYVDNAAMQLVRAPKQFDVIVTSNLFGDVLSDLAAMLTGSIGMLPSASLNHQAKGLYEPIHGSAPDIAGQGVANPLATVLSLSMLLRYSLDQPDFADRVEAAVVRVLAAGLRTADIHTKGRQKVSTDEMGDAVVAALSSEQPGINA